MYRNICRLASLVRKKTYVYAVITLNTRTSMTPTPAIFFYYTYSFVYKNTIFFKYLEEVLDTFLRTKKIVFRELERCVH